MTEEWREVPGHAGYYASSEGLIRGPRGGLVGSSGRDGYIRIGISGPPRRCLSRASMVALAFIGPRPPGLDIDHIDAVRSNDRPDNLRYVTHAENVACVTPQTGVKNGRAKLTPDIVELIRLSDSSERAAARKYNVSPSTIHLIRHGLIWRTDNASKREAHAQPDSNPSRTPS